MYSPSFVLMSALGFRFTGIPLLFSLLCYGKLFVIHNKPKKTSIQSDAHVQCIVLPATYLYQKIDVSIQLLCACQVLHVPCFTHYAVVGNLQGPRSVKNGPKKR